MCNRSIFNCKIYKIKKILLFLLIFSCIIILFNFGSNVYFRTFSRKKWINYPLKRYLMTDDLINRNILQGLSKKDVYSLLGTQNATEIGKRTLTYTVGGDYYIRVIVISFDDNDIVYNVTTYVD